MGAPLVSPLGEALSFFFISPELPAGPVLTGWEPAGASSDRSAAFPPEDDDEEEPRSFLFDSMIGDDRGLS